MAMTATARRVGTTLKHEINVNDRNVIFTDEPEDLGGTDQGPAPHELLAAMLASCIATMDLASVIRTYPRSMDKGR
jgi:putative redox protein